MIALLVLVGDGGVGWSCVRAARGRARRRAPFAFQGAGGAPAATAPRQYSPDNVGNDASARPWERSSMAFDAGKSQDAAAAVRWSGLA